MDLYNASNGTEEDETIHLNLDEYEEAKESLKTIIARAESARRIAADEDFNKLIMIGYLSDEPKRLAELMSSGRLPAASMESCTRELDAIGRFRNFMKMNIEQGNTAIDELTSLEEARQEAILAEEEEAGK